MKTCRTLGCDGARNLKDGQGALLIISTEQEIILNSEKKL